MNFPPESKDRDELLKKWQHVLDAASHIRSWTDGHELAWLCEVAANSHRMMEIGSYYGKSALCMALANPDLSLLAIDNAENKEVPEEFAKNLEEPINEGRVKLRIGTSQMLARMPVLSLDCVFIDAGHKQDDVHGDVRHSLRHIREGGIICGHDWSKDPNDGVNLGVTDHFILHHIHVFDSIWWVQL